MRIPDGDLVPARRHRYGGGFSRRRRRRLRRLALFLVLLLAAAAVAWLVQRDETPATQSLTACPTPTPSASAGPAPLPSPASVHLVLLNGTPRNGLAQQVGQALGARGFVVTREDNAPAALAGPSVVTYGPGALPGATVLARHVLGAGVVAAPRARSGSLQLVLGGDFRRLATPAEVLAAAATDAGGSVVPAPTRTPCAA